MRRIVSVSSWAATLVLVACSGTADSVTASEESVNADNTSQSATTGSSAGPLDTNGDGAISRAEFVAGASDMLQHQDANGDGVLSEDELAPKGCPAPPPDPDTNHDGQVTSAEAEAAAQKLFAHLDKDGTGLIDISALPPAPPDAPSAASLDTDGDGRISLDEFLAGAAARFAAADTNGDGVLSGDELKPPAPPPGCMKPPPGAPQPPSFADLDTNGDGSVSLSELQTDFDNRFDALDIDGNGLLEGSELPPAPPQH